MSTKHPSSSFPRLYYSLLFLASLIILWAARYPGASTATLLFIAAIIGFGIRCLVALARQDAGWHALLASTIGVGVLLFVITGLEIPARIAFNFSEPAMRRHAEDILAGKIAPDPSFPSGEGGTVGLFHFDSISLLPGTDVVFFYLEDGGIFTNAGWTYSPYGTPRPPIGEAGPGTQTPYSGPWYRTELHW